MKTYFILVIFSFGLIVNSQETVEHIALHYFLENILEKEFKTNNLKIKFSGKTEAYTTGLFYSVDCIASNELNLVDNPGFNLSSSINLFNKKLIYRLNNSNSQNKAKKFILSIYRNIEINENKIVLITLYEKNSIFYYFYIKVDKNEAIIDWCKKAALI